jgi:hypothetical protein
MFRACEGELVKIPPAAILDQHLILYSEPTGDLEDYINDLHSFPYIDEDNRPIPIYDEDGEPVPRYTGRPVGDAAQGAVFIALDRVHQMFSDPLVPLEEPRYIHSNSIDKYPIAHLPNVGCIQTRQPLPLFTSVVSAINREIGSIIPPEEADDFGYTDVDDDGFILPARAARKSPLYGTHTQIYNVSTHHFAPRANEFRVLHGQVTAAASGFFAATQSERTAAAKAALKISHDFPYEILESQIDSVDIPTAMRVEQCFVIDFKELDPEYQNGRCEFYKLPAKFTINYCVTYLPITAHCCSMF